MSENNEELVKIASALPKVNEDLVNALSTLAKEYEDNIEMCHFYMDEAILTALEALGFEEAVAIFNSMPKWYA